MSNLWSANHQITQFRRNWTNALTGSRHNLNILLKTIGG